MITACYKRVGEWRGYERKKKERCHLVPLSFFFFLLLLFVQFTLATEEAHKD